MNFSNIIVKELNDIKLFHRLNLLQNDDDIEHRFISLENSDIFSPSNVASVNKNT